MNGATFKRVIKKPVDQADRDTEQERDQPMISGMLKNSV